MRILLSYLCGVALLASCQKESSFLQSKESSSSEDGLSQMAKKSKSYFIIDETSSTFNYPPNEGYNSCYPEPVHFAGPIGYTMQFLQSGNEYYISYDIDFSQFSALGATSGLNYSITRWRFKDIIPVSTESTEGSTVIGRKILEITLRTSAGNSISVDENIEFLFSKAARVYATFTESIVGCH